MEKKIISEKENPLFSRKEVKIEVNSNLTPSNEESRNIVAEEFKVNPEVVRIRKVDSIFGATIFTIIADIYDSIEEFNRIVKKTKQEIKAEEEAKKAAEEAKKAEEEAKKAEAEKSVEEEKTEEKTE